MTFKLWLCLLDNYLSLFLEVMKCFNTNLFLKTLAVQIGMMNKYIRFQSKCKFELVFVYLKIK